MRACTHVQVWDNDGEFLLIEAAYALPKWLKPECATNRVWLRGGNLHIVPLPSAKHPSLPSSPSVSQALEVRGLGHTSVWARAHLVYGHGRTCV